MSQNLLSLDYSEADLAEIDGALAILEKHFAKLPELSPDDRRQLNKMGDKSEPFCRQALIVLAQNTGALPPNFDLAEAQNDLAQLDALRPHLHRLEVLAARGADGEMALGSDIINACQDGYTLLKVVGKGAGLEALRLAMMARLSRPAKPKMPPTGGQA